MEYLGRINDVASIRLGGDVLLSEMAKKTLLARNFNATHSYKVDFSQKKIFTVSLENLALAATKELIHFHVPSVRNIKYC